MIKKIFYSILACCTLLILGCTHKEKLHYAAPSVIPNTLRDMKSAGFWISHHPYPDKVILDSQRVFLFNVDTEDRLKLIKDVTKIGPRYSGTELISVLREDIKKLSKQKFYNKCSKIVGRSFYRHMEEQMNFTDMPSWVDVRYGFVLHYADQRILPTEEALTVEIGDNDFDELQNSSLDIGTPLAILHESKDGLWVYAHTPTSLGWIKKDKIVLAGLDEFRNFIEKKPFAVVVSPKADIFLDSGLTQYYDYVRMGAKFSVNENPNLNVTEILIPFQRENKEFLGRVAYIKKEDVNIGYLSYTARNIIIQAFKLLNAPYGWGGLNGEQDCSSFLQEIFATVGITLPRNSKDQGSIGRLLAEFKEKTKDSIKLDLLNKQAIGGITILQLKGHVLLYLGIYNTKPYAIHETHGYGQRKYWWTVGRILNRVVVSDLFLGKGSEKGSLLGRIIFIRSIE